MGQGAFYLATGLWPIVHLPSFEAVTGPKLEGWLVKTVGAMIAVAGSSMLAAGRARSVGAPTALLAAGSAAALAAGSAAALAAVDLWYAGVRRRIRPIYLADAVVELALFAGWAPALARRG